MSEKFLQLNIECTYDHPGDWLAAKHPNAFILLYFIARRARRFEGSPDGLGIGMAKIGDWEKIGLTRQNYRTALKILTTYKFLEILETNRTRKKSTNKSTTEGTLVRLLDSRVWDINPMTPNHSSNHCLTTAQPLPNHEQERKERSRSKEDHHPYPSSSPTAEPDGLTDDFSQIEKSKGEMFAHTFAVNGKEITVTMTQIDLDACVNIKGSIDNVKNAIEYIMKSPGRKSKIFNWPNAMATWNIKANTQALTQKNEQIGRKLDQKFSKANGWRCEMYNDRKKDLRGILFSNSTPTGNSQPIFIAFIDVDFESKVNKLLSEKRMMPV